MIKFIGIIPARFASTRFPGKPLAKLGGISMIERVYKRAARSLGSNLLVATDDTRIYDEVTRFGGNVVMTSTEHRSGTDRCYEAYKVFGSDADVIVNIQGDEPFIASEQIDALKDCFHSKADVQIATLVRPFDASRGFEALANPNTPKVVLDDDMNALYFSRSVIPYVRGKEFGCWPSATQYYTHIGMYAYTSEALASIVALPQSSLELAESLEQLRWLQAGYRIATASSTVATVGIDTPADLEAAEKLLCENPDIYGI